MERAKTRRRGEHHHVGRGDGVFIGVEADEHRVLVHLDFLFVFLLQVIEAPLQLVFEDIGHGHQFDAATGAEGLIRRAGTAPPAANERQPKGVAGRSAEGEALDWQRAEERAAGDGGGGGFKENPAIDLAGARWVDWLVHVCLSSLSFFDVHPTADYSRGGKADGYGG